MKNNKFKIILTFILGGLVFGTVSAVATNYLLKAEDVEYKNNKNLQDAIDELYGMASNQKGSNEPLSITASVSGSNIELTYNGTYDDVKCIYGLGESYGSVGAVNGNKCLIPGQPNKLHYYKIIASNNDGIVYDGNGSIMTNAGPTIQRTNLVSSTGATYQGLIGIAYLNPTNLGTSCNASNSVSTTGTKTGCMKWYIYDTVTVNNTQKYVMILDHNTTASIIYRATGSGKGMGTAVGDVGYDLQELTNTSKWDSTLSPKLITANEIAKIVGKTGVADWTYMRASNDWFYFDSLTQTQTAKSKGASSYAWLFDYTSGCISYGCNVEDSSVNGYWSGTYDLSVADIWVILNNGSFGGKPKMGSNAGLRPVIEVPIDIF